MQLDMGIFPVAEIRLGHETRLEGDVLLVDRNEIRRLVLEDPRISRIEVEIVKPGESVRVIHVCDALEPRIKIEGRGVCYPGVLGSMDTVGQGVTHRLHGMSVVVSAEYPRLIETGVGAAHEAILEMSGPGALGPLSQTMNLVLALDLAPGHSQVDCHDAIRTAGLKVSHRLARTTERIAPPSSRRYELSPADPGLPRVVYVHQLFTQLNLPAPYLTWYGTYITDWMPIWVHPNEILDGALMSGAVGKDAVRPTTWEHVNNPVIERLFQVHGRDINFLGIILHRTRFEVFEEKQLSANQAARLARLMNADGALVTWIGAGNAFIEGMLTVQALEREGIKAVFMTYEHGGKEGLEPPMMFTVPEADAIISLGSLDRPMKLPPVERAVGGDTLNLDPEAGEGRISATGELSLDWYLPIAGGIDHWGFGKQACVEY